MRFSDDRHSDKGFASVAVPLAVRFARFALAAVLAASFMPVAAFADEGEPTGPEGVQDQPAQTEQAQQGDPAAVDGESVDEGVSADEGVQNSSGQQTEGVQQTEGIQQGEQPEASTSEPAEAEDDQNLSTQDNPPQDNYVEKVSCDVKPGQYFYLKVDYFTHEKYGRYSFNLDSKKIEGEGVINEVIPSDTRYKFLAKCCGTAQVELVFSASDGPQHLRITYEIKVSPYEITLTPNSKSGIYDGTEKSVSGFETLNSTIRSEGVTSLNGPFQSETYSNTVVVGGLSAGVQRTDAGEYPVEVTGQAVVTDKDNKDVTPWCQLSYADAKLVIGKRPVTLTSASASKEYDGTPLTNNEAVTVGGYGWAECDSVTCSATGSQTDAGTSKNSIDVTFNSGNAGNYDITKVEGDLVVGQRPMTLKSADLDKEFDGTPLTNGAAPIEGEDFAHGEGAAYTFTGTQKIVGSSENAFECIPNEGTNLDNYQIDKTYGTLTVTDRSEKYQITLIPNSKSETYDGTEKSVSGFEALEFEVDGSTYTVEGLTAEAKGTDAGEYPVEVTGDAVVTDSDGNDVTSQFDVVIDDAKLIIVKDDPAPVDPDNPDKPSSDTPSKTTGKATAAKASAAKPASKSAKTGDSIALYAMGIFGAAIAAGAVAFVARRKRNSGK